MSVTRFKVDSRGLLMEHPQGSLVAYSEASALESKLGESQEQRGRANDELQRLQSVNELLKASLKRSEGQVAEYALRLDANLEVLKNVVEERNELRAVRDSLTGRLDSARAAFRAADNGSNNDWCDATKESWPVNSDKWLALEDALFESKHAENNALEDALSELRGARFVIAALCKESPDGTLYISRGTLERLSPDASIECTTGIDGSRQYRVVESQEIKCCKCGKPTDPISAAAHKDGAGWICRDCFYVPV